MKMKKTYALALGLLLGMGTLRAQENQITLIEFTEIDGNDEIPVSRESYEYDQNDQLTLWQKFTWSEEQHRYIKERQVRYIYEMENGLLLEKRFEHLNAEGVAYYSGSRSYSYYENGCTKTETIMATTDEEPSRAQEINFYNEQTCELDSILLYNRDNQANWKLVEKTEFEYNDSGLIRRYYYYYQNNWLYKGQTVVEFNEAGKPTSIWTDWSDFVEEEARSYEYDEHQNVILEKYLLKIYPESNLVLRMLRQNHFSYNTDGKALTKRSVRTDYDIYSGAVDFVSISAVDYDYYCDGLRKSELGSDGSKKTYYYEKGSNCAEDGASRIILHPNPTSSQLTISSEGLLQADSHIRIFDASGALMYSEVVKERIDQRELAVGHLPAGVYFVQIGEGRAKRFVKG